MRKVLIAITVITLILSILSTGLIVLLAPASTTSNTPVVSGE